MEQFYITLLSTRLSCTKRLRAAQTIIRSISAALESRLWRMRWQDLPEACPRGLCVCLTSDETPESSGNSDQYAKELKDTPLERGWCVFTSRRNNVVKGMNTNRQTNNKICCFLLRSYLGRHKVLGHLHTAIKISHLEADVTRSRTWLMKSYFK